MKSLITLTLLLIFSMVSAQNRPDRQHHRKFSDRFEELEKLKLLEILDLDEETAIKFFSRRNEMKKKITSIIKMATTNK